MLFAFAREHLGCAVVPSEQVLQDVFTLVGYTEHLVNCQLVFRSKTGAKFTQSIWL